MTSELHSLVMLSSPSAHGCRDLLGQLPAGGLGVGVLLETFCWCSKHVRLR